jgi:hypothetical protein
LATTAVASQIGLCAACGVRPSAALDRPGGCAGDGTASPRRGPVSGAGRGGLCRLVWRGGTAADGRRSAHTHVRITGPHRTPPARAAWQCWARARRVPRGVAVTSVSGAAGGDLHPRVSAAPHRGLSFAHQSPLWTVMSGRTPNDVDVEQPNVARMCDYYLGGGHHFAVDRRAADAVIAAAPGVIRAARANRTSCAARCATPSTRVLGSSLISAAVCPPSAPFTPSRTALIRPRPWCTSTSIRLPWRTHAGCGGPTRR